MRGTAGGVLDVGGSQAVARRDERRDVGRLRCRGGDVAVPDGGACLAVGQSDRDDVVEAAVAQERGIQGANEVRGADEQAPVALTELGHELEQLVRDALRGRGRRAAATRRDLFDLVDEDDGVLELADLLERRAQRPREARRPVGQARGEDLDERPVQARGDGLGEGRLSRAGRAEQHDRARRHDPEALGHVGARQRGDETLFEQVFLLTHAAHRAPEVTRQDAPADLFEQVELATLHRHLALEVAERIAHLEPVGGEGGEGLLSLGEQDRELAQPERGHAPLEGVEQPGGDLVGLRHGRHPEEHDPPLRVRGAAHSDADERVVTGRDDGVVGLARGDHLGERVDGRLLSPVHLFPQPDHGVEVVVMEISDVRAAHNAIVPDAAPHPRARPRLARTRRAAPAVPAPAGRAPAGPRAARRPRPRVEREPGASIRGVATVSACRGAPAAA